MLALASSQVVSFCLDTALGKFTCIAYHTSLCPYSTPWEARGLGTDRNESNVSFKEFLG